jgi:hypothetical protein
MERTSAQPQALWVCCAEVRWNSTPLVASSQRSKKLIFRKFINKISRAHNELYSQLSDYTQQQRYLFRPRIILSCHKH